MIDCSLSLTVFLASGYGFSKVVISLVNNSQTNNRDTSLLKKIYDLLLVVS